RCCPFRSYHQNMWDGLRLASISARTDAEFSGRLHPTCVSIRVRFCGVRMTLCSLALVENRRPTCANYATKTLDARIPRADSLTMVGCASPPPAPTPKL